MSFPSMMRVVVAVALLGVGLRVLASREHEAPAVEETTSDCQALTPNMPPNDCKGALYGSLVVGCVSAQGLKNVDGWTSLSDPSCRVRISDANPNNLEERGGVAKTMKLFNKEKKGSKKFPLKSEEMLSSEIQNNLNPTWNEAFQFDFVCPESPDHHDQKYQLEVIVQDGGLVQKTKFLGAVYFTLDDIVNAKMSELSQSTHTLQKSAADPDYKGNKNVQGEVTLVVHWCPNDGSHSNCIENTAVATKTAGHKIKDIKKVDCHMGCHTSESGCQTDLVADLRSFITSAKDDIKAAKRAKRQMDAQDQLGNLAGQNADRYDTNQDRGNWSNHHHFEKLEHEAEADQRRHERSENMYREKMMRYWRSAGEKVASLQRDIRGKAQATYGKRVAELASGTVSRVSMGSYFSDDAVFDAGNFDNVLLALDEVKANVKSLGTCLQDKWWEGAVFPASRTVSNDCTLELS